jgi:hypothetical protein
MTDVRGTETFRDFKSFEVTFTLHVRLTSAHSPMGERLTDGGQREVSIASLPNGHFLVHHSTKMVWLPPHEVHIANSTV